MKVVLASNNQHKYEEIQAILSKYDIELLLPVALGLNIEPDENGTTFEENSLIKARAFAEATGLPALADDSGLSVDALNGAPGVYSARYGGEMRGMDRLLKDMEAIPKGQRIARFVCVITLLQPDGTSLVARGTCEGEITMRPYGESGFGYDPVFFVPGEGCTFAQMSSERKNKISHRANALKIFCKKLEEM